jgi:hypothetical protein
VIAPLLVADVRSLSCSAPINSSALALTLLVAQSTLVLSNFVRLGGPREIQSTRENWRTTVTSQSIRSESRRTEHDVIRPMCRYCCKSRKSNNPKNLAKVDL